MDAEQIVKLTPESIRALLASQHVACEPKEAGGRRRAERWPFAGAVEVWLPDDCYGERHVLATLHNISLHGLAMRSRRPIATETRLALAIHEPAMSLYGHAVVRHCTRGHVGYIIGVEFSFHPEEE